MDKNLLANEVQEFIEINSNKDIATLALQKNPFPLISWTSILNQISGKQKAEHKLPTWFNTKNILYPSKISIEQTSSEKTAQYKASLVSGNSILDATGGFGIDDYYFSKVFTNVYHSELNEELSEIVSHNWQSLGVNNVENFAQDSTEVLKKLNKKLDWIYIDPSRRNDAKGKVFMLKDCLPNVPDLLDFYFEYTDKLLIKTSPILDISLALTELKNVKEIHVVAIENEVKELLFIIEKKINSLVKITTVNLLKNSTESFLFKFKKSVESFNFSLPKLYLYEPNAAIMKAAGYDYIHEHYPVEKLHIHSHLFTSDNFVEFPGRTFKIISSFEYHKSNMKTFLESKKANITTRNFPETVESIRKKWKIKDGGNLYCFFTTNLNNDKIVLLCEKIN